MIKETGSSNKPGARDVCGARRGELRPGRQTGALHLQRESYQGLKKRCSWNVSLDYIDHSQEICTKFNLVIPVLLTSVGWSENCSFVLLIVQCRMETDQLKFLIWSRPRDRGAQAWSIWPVEIIPTRGELLANLNLISEIPTTSLLLTFNSASKEKNPFSQKEKNKSDQSQCHIFFFRQTSFPLSALAGSGSNVLI